MALYSGETITIKASAKNPLAGSAITDATATVELYALGADPKNVVEDRVPASTQAMSYDEATQSYLAYVNTDGFAAGKYAYRVVLSGAYDSWEYGAFTLKA